ncbi:MAG TPA: CoA transferase [Bacteroidia bacterium]|jgi:crotonobetainyl-CoA:carnitine CoA-transferase CaiB-like acyl-CoA transferase
MKNFFSDLKVIELANVLAGPAVGMFFAELGAEVLKIENMLTNGDVTRSWKLSKEDPASPVSAYFASVNWNKKFIRVNLTLQADKQKVYELVKTADIVICNYKPGDDVKLGMDHDTIKSLNPAIIYAGITGFGEHTKRTAYDLVLQAETGFMSMNGNKASGPLKMPVALIDVLAAHQLKEGILIALINRYRTGKGSKVSVSLYDAAIASLANQASNWLMANENPQPIGSLHPNIAPYGEFFLTSDDQQIVLAVGNNKQFLHLLKVLGNENLASDERFQTNTGRVTHRGELYEELKGSFRNADAESLMENFIAHDVPAGVIKSLKEVFKDEAAKKLINSGMSENMKTYSVKTAIFRIEEN